MLNRIDILFTCKLDFFNLFHKYFPFLIDGKRNGSACPVALHPKAVEALTLHTGVRNRRMEITGIKNACHIVAGFPALGFEERHKYINIFTKNKHFLKKNLQKIFSLTLIFYHEARNERISKQA